MARHSLSEPLKQASPSWERIARDDAHRPWPSPARSWALTQRWGNLLFAHWPVPYDQVRALVPLALALDAWEGHAWVGVVPFHLGRLSPRGAPAGVSISFPELNVRTYVTAEGKPGVWFFSLDAANILAVIGARAAYHLPYFWADMRIDDESGWISYTSKRRHPGAPAAEFVGRYRAIGPVVRSGPGSFEQWLTERYCLYSSDRRGRIYRGDILHPPWPLQPAEAEVSVNTMAAAHGIDLTGAPVLHFARQLDMVAWSPERLG